MSLSITPLVEEEGADVDRVVGVGVAVDSDHFERNCASLRLTIQASIATIIGKGSKEEKRTPDWRKSLVIVEGKMSLSRVAVSL